MQKMMAPSMPIEIDTRDFCFDPGARCKVLKDCKQEMKKSGHI